MYLLNVFKAHQEQQIKVKHHLNDSCLILTVTFVTKLLLWSGIRQMPIKG